MSHPRRKKKKSLALPLLLLFLTLLVVSLGLLLLLSARAETEMTFLSGGQETTAPTREETEPETQPAPVYAPVTAANANASDVRYAASYTVDPAAASGLSAKTVASAGSTVLTNGELQILYLRQVADWQAGDHAEKPDFSAPLDCQLCPLGSGDLSWQHYFLQQAISAWQLEQAAVKATRDPIPLNDGAYQKIDKWDEYITPDLPVNKFLYADRPCYTPNLLHQAWLDALPETLNDAARALGYADADDYAAKVYGAGVGASELAADAWRTNLAYMYMTEMTFDAAETDPVPISAVNADGTVDIRHTLLIPEGAQIAADGTVTADDDAWDACERRANMMLADLKRDPITVKSEDAAFARLANENSADAGSALNGGLYSMAARGDLIDGLDRWAFASDRVPGDSAIIRTELGVHIVYLKAAYDPGAREARTSLMTTAMTTLARGLRGKNLLKPDYSAAALWCDTTAAVMTTDAVLYPDVAHERFPEALTFLQQDYFYYPFGYGRVGDSGCSITTLAILATYMTDRIQTPAMLADRYGNYVSDGNMFRYTPAEMGFFVQELSGDVNLYAEVLMNGQRVVVLEQGGHFTTKGHFLFLQAYDPETDTFQIRDSNIFNYGQYAKPHSGHLADRFTRQNLQSGLSNGYVMQKKIVRLPECVRCGDTFTEHAPEKLLRVSYTCPRCTTALARRNGFLTVLAQPET